MNRIKKLLKNLFNGTKGLKHWKGRGLTKTLQNIWPTC